MSIHRLQLICLLLPLAVLALSGCPRVPDDLTIRVEENGSRPDQPTDPAALLQAARAEGQLSWYTSLKQEEADAFVAAFTRQHPDLRVTVRRGSTFGIEDEINKELQSGFINADVVHVLDPGFFLRLRAESRLGSYKSPQAAAIPAIYQGDDYWWTARILTLGIAYDTRRVRPSQAPKTWFALSEPRWQDRIGLKDADSAGAAYAHLYLLRERYGAHYWEQLARHGARVYATEPELLTRLRKGEIDLAAGVALGRPDGSDNLRLITPQDGVPVVVGPVAILANARHPSAARVFVDFMLSRTGQETLRDLLGAYSPRADVSAPKGLPPLNQLKLLQPTRGWSDYGADQEVLQAEFKALFEAAE